MAFTSKSLADGFAVEIEGIDLARDLDDQTFDDLRRIWMASRSTPSKVGTAERW